MKKRRFLEKAETSAYRQEFDEYINYLFDLGLFPNIEIDEYPANRGAQAILDYNEAKEILDKVEYYVDDHTFKGVGLQEKKGTIIFKFKADEYLEDYCTDVQITMQNRLADSSLSKGQYKITVKFM